MLFSFAWLGQAPVVDDQDVNAGDPGQDPRVGVVSAGQGQFVEETRGAAVESRVAAPAGLLPG